MTEETNTAARNTVAIDFLQRIAGCTTTDELHGRPPPPDDYVPGAFEALLNKIIRGARKALAGDASTPLERSHTIRMHLWNGVMEAPKGMPPGVRLVVKETDTAGEFDHTDGEDENGHPYCLSTYEGEGTPPCPHERTDNGVCVECWTTITEEDANG